MMITNIDRQQLLLNIEERHEKEMKELEIKSTALLKAAKKSSKAQIEAQIIQMQYDLRAAHRDELEEFENGNELETIDACVEIESSKKDENLKNQAAVALEIEKKKLKAKSKQQKRDAKNTEKQRQYDEMRLTSGPSLRELEIDKICMKLRDDSMRIKTILSDGNCLYRAIADQLQLTGHTGDYEIPDWIQLRMLAAKYIRNDPEEYAPFLGLSNSMNAEELIQFHDYCKHSYLALEISIYRLSAVGDKVESSSLAVWGGQMEIQALSKCLRRTILVVSADSPTLRMGLDDDDDSISSSKPLRISYHKHFYALGAHYNSLVPIE